MKLLIITPEGWSCTFAECRPGLFVIGDWLYLKTEYKKPGIASSINDAYCANGELFSGGTNTNDEQNALIVQPVEYRWVEVEE